MCYRAPVSDAPSPYRLLARRLELLVRARYPVIYLLSAEESRVTALAERVARKRKKPLFVWSATTGLVEGGTSLESERTRRQPTRDPLAALDRVVDDTQPGVYVFYDLHPYLDAARYPAVVRRLREVALHLRRSAKTIMLVSPVLALPVELAKEVTVFDVPLPERDELGELLDELTSSLQLDPPLGPDTRERLIDAARGLTLTEASNVLARLVVGEGGLSADHARAVYAEKRQILRASGLLDYIEPTLDLEGVGGLSILKRWLAERRLAFSQEAREFGLPSPRGLLLVGVQGCGKSLCAMAVGASWQLPLLRLDVGRLFGGVVGESERNVREALAIADSLAPCVLWIDELDKAFASGGSKDGGTAARVLGRLLTWMQEKTSPVFVLATANDVSGLPPELLRKGRFDELFFVDLPTAHERQQILAVHLTRRGRDPQRYDLRALGEASDGFSGAELEQAVIDGLFTAFQAGRELADEDIRQALNRSVPLSRTMAEPIEALRRWADGRARCASTDLRRVGGQSTAVFNRPS